MATKNHYYVLVFTDNGAKFVTGFAEHHTALFESDKTPKEMSKKMADEVNYGLNLNGFNAVTASSPWEIGNQPYCYDRGHFEWHWDKEN